MQKISVHVPDDMKFRIALVAKIRNQGVSDVIREAIDKGLQTSHPKSTSGQALLNLAKMAEELASETPPITDLSINHDYYAWGGAKSGDQK